MSDFFFSLLQRLHQVKIKLECQGPFANKYFHGPNRALRCYLTFCSPEVRQVTLQIYDQRYVPYKLGGFLMRKTQLVKTTKFWQHFNRTFVMLNSNWCSKKSLSAEKLSANVTFIPMSYSGFFMQERNQASLMLIKICGYDLHFAI